jgi:hypothetical protein
MNQKFINYFAIGTFVLLYILTSCISTIHVIDFFRISNPEWLAITLAIAFEVGAAASLASIIAMKKMNKGIVWALFITLTAMQAMGNTYFAYVHLVNYQSWVELFGLIDEEIITQKRILSMVSGAILPLVALGFIKSLVDYIKPDEGVNDGVNEGVNDQITNAVTQTLPIDVSKEINENIPPYQPTQTDLQKFEELLKKYDKKFFSDNLTNTVANNYEELPENIQENNVIDVIVEPIIEDIIVEDENIETETIDEPVIKDIIIEDENVIEDIIEPTINDIIVEDENIDEEVEEELTTNDNQEEVIEKKN